LCQSASNSLIFISKFGCPWSLIYSSSRNNLLLYTWTICKIPTVGNLGVWTIWYVFSKYQNFMPMQTIRWSGQSTGNCGILFTSVHSIALLMAEMMSKQLIKHTWGVLPCKLYSFKTYFIERYNKIGEKSSPLPNNVNFAHLCYNKLTAEKNYTLQTVVNEF
jgi:hypothetical protein